VIMSLRVCDYTLACESFERLVCVCVCHYTCACVRDYFLVFVIMSLCACVYTSLGWLRLVGSLKS